MNPTPHEDRCTITSNFLPTPSCQQLPLQHTHLNLHLTLHHQVLGEGVGILSIWLPSNGASNSSRCWPSGAGAADAGQEEGDEASLSRDEESHAGTGRHELHNGLSTSSALQEWQEALGLVDVL